MMNTESENIITYVAFYGGAKGQTLQITEFANGTVKTVIIKNDEVPLDSTDISDSKETTDTQESEVSKDIKSIHRTAETIIKLQNAAKTNGQLTEDEQENYNQQMEQLNLATRNLAQFQQAQQDEDIDNDEMSRSNLRFWFEQKKNKLMGKPNEENKEEEQTNGEEGTEQVEEIDDGVAINLPPEDASVAEAKPVGLAVAGVGGVAASKPVATAVVGPAGLAIARPVATAIAGVSPEDAMIPIYADGYIKFPEKRKQKVPNRVTSTDNCKGDKCDKKKEENPSSERPSEKPKQDYLSAYAMRNYEY